MNDSEAAYLHRLGERLRLARTRRGMTLRALATQSGVSLRFIAQTEAGTGNLSVLRLRQLVRALDISPTDLLLDRTDAQARADALLGGLPLAQQDEAADLLIRHFSNDPLPGRPGRIALIGLRGAGKSTLGRLLAARRGIPFHELDRDIEEAAGTPLAEIFELHGQAGFRRLERQALDQLIASNTDIVIAAGGSIVATPATYDLLLRACRTVWIRASPEEHMRRVIEQGDLRPMRDNRNAMNDLRAILSSREPLYARAELQLDTTGHSAEDSARYLADLLRAAP